MLVSPDDLSLIEHTITAYLKDRELYWKSVDDQFLCLIILCESNEESKINRMLDRIKPSSLMPEFISNNVHNSIKMLYGFPYVIYNYFIENIPVEHSEEACVDDEFIDEQFEAFYRSKRRAIDGLYQSIATLQSLLSQIRENKKFKEDVNDGSSELLVGAASVASFFTAGLAAPLAMWAGRSMYEKHKKNKTLDQKNAELHDMLENQRKVVDSKIDDILEMIDEEHSKVAQSMLRQIAAVLSNMIAYGAIRECPAYILLYQFSPKDTGQSKVK